MYSIIKKISRKFGTPLFNNTERHQDNILQGEQLELDGKKYVKVKLKFVDTMGFNLAKHVDNLEAENDLLRNELKGLQAKYDSCKVKVDELQCCNINIFRDIRKTKEALLDKKTHLESLTFQLKGYGDRIKEYDKDIGVQGKKIKEQEVLLKKYKRLRENDGKTIEKQYAEIARLTKELEYKGENNNILLKKSKRVEKSRESELEGKQLLIETLTDKLFSQKTEIDYLRTKLKGVLITDSRQ